MNDVLVRNPGEALLSSVAIEKSELNPVTMNGSELLHRTVVINSAGIEPISVPKIFEVKDLASQRGIEGTRVLISRRRAHNILRRPYDSESAASRGIHAMKA